MWFSFHQCSGSICGIAMFLFVVSWIKTDNSQCRPTQPPSGYSIIHFTIRFSLQSNLYWVFDSFGVFSYSGNLHWFGECVDEGGKRKTIGGVSGVSIMVKQRDEMRVKNEVELKIESVLNELKKEDPISFPPSTTLILIQTSEIIEVNQMSVIILTKRKMNSSLELHSWDRSDFGYRFPVSIVQYWRVQLTSDCYSFLFCDVSVVIESIKESSPLSWLAYLS